MQSLRFLVAPFLLVLVFAGACSDHPSQTLSSPDAMTATSAPQVEDAILFLRFDHNLVDESIYNWPVYFQGTPGFKSGCSDGAAMFEGDEYAYLSGDPLFQPAQVTVEVWMSPKRALTNNSGFHPLVVKYAGNFWNTVDGYDLWYQDSGAGGRVGFGIGTSGGAVRKHASLTTPLVPSRLYHIVGTFDGTYARLHVNGEQVAATLHTQPLAYLGGGIRIGGGVYHSFYGQGYQSYRGLIDQVAIFPRAMSDQEIQSRYLSCNEKFLVNFGGGGGTKDDAAFSE